MATYGPYASAKFALEAVSDSLRREVEPLGVRVVVIEPGAVRTDMLGRVAENGATVVGSMTDEQRGRYARLMRGIVSQARAAGGRSSSPEQVARVIADAIASARPRPRYTVGRDAAMVVRLARYLSDRTLDRLLARGLKPHIEE